MEIIFVKCPHCGASVLPMDNNCCPNCRLSLQAESPKTVSETDSQHDATTLPPALPKPAGTQRHTDWFLVSIVSMAVGIVLGTALFNTYVNSTIGKGVIHVSPHNIERMSGDFVWRFFSWGILRGDVMTSGRIWLMDHLGVSYHQVAALDITNPTPFMIFITLMFIAYIRIVFK